MQEQNTILSTNFATIRRRWRMTQAEMGTLMGGVSRNTISNWETGRTEMEPGDIALLEKLTGLEVGRFEFHAGEVPEEPLGDAGRGVREVPVGERLRRMEERLERMEEMLMELLERGK